MKEVVEMGLWFLGFKALKLMNNAADLQAEKLKQEEMKTEMMRLEQEIALLKAQGSWKALESLSPAELEDEFKRQGWVT